MSLPKISHPTFSLDVPSLKQKVKVRPMLAKEEKLLLIAKESDDPTDVLSVIRQVVNNCVVDETFDIDALALFDLEYLFLKLRGVSVSNLIQVAYVDQDDKQTYDFEIDLDKIAVKWPEPRPSNTVLINDKISMRLRYPRASLYNTHDFLKANNDRELGELLLEHCIEAVIDGKTISKMADADAKDKTEFLDNLPIPAKQGIANFVGNLPSLYHQIKYTNKNGIEREIELKTLNDFFILR